MFPLSKGGAYYWRNSPGICELILSHLLPVGISKDDELLFETQDGRIVSYNLYMNKFRKVSLPAAVHPGFTSATLRLKTLSSF